MDSVERMRRLNELTKELKARGFAESSFEAIAQANQIYGDDEITEEVKHGIIANSAHDKMGKSSEVERMADDQTDKKIKKVQDDLNLLTEKMNEIIKAINDMDARINQLKSRPVERTERVLEHEKPVVEHATVSESKPHDEKPAHGEFENQRVGNFQSQDVAIDKMFYFGNKK